MTTNGWPMVPLGKLLTRNEPAVVIEPATEYKEVTVRLWGNGVVLRGIVTGSEIAATRRFAVRSNQFILSRIDARNGAMGLVPPELDGAVVSNDFPSFDIDARQLLPAFLGWLSKTKGFVDTCRATSEGTTNRVRLQQTRFVKQEIPLPPLPEQRRIVAKIERLAAKINEAQRVGTQSLCTSAALARGSSHKIVNAIDRKYWRPLNSVVSIEGGTTPSKSNPAFWGGSVPWISPKDMKAREIWNSQDHITDVALQSGRVRLNPPGTVLVVIRGMILLHTFPVAVLRTPATINQDMKALTPQPGLAAEYLCAILWALNDQALALVDRSGHDTRKLNTSKLEALEIPVPPEPEQRRIVAYLDGLQAMVDELKRLQADSAAELDALLPAILDRAFKGQL
ncbi:MAG: restriction endonuclease subunit S [Pirellulales bacterium]